MSEPLDYNENRESGETGGENIPVVEGLFQGRICVVFLGLFRILMLK
ncbi:MAG TPA: hypothetical protein VGO47_09565 [Chlamydiales bacterium]|nr:hypothetical protein [Chlamydiales bacterium]